MMSAVAEADFNNDGRVDKAVVTSPTSITVSLQKADGSYVISAVLTAPKNQPVTGLYVDDFNRDGKLDVAAGGVSSNSRFYQHTWLSNGDGTFAARKTEAGRFPKWFI